MKSAMGVVSWTGGAFGASGQVNVVVVALSVRVSRGVGCRGAVSTSVRVDVVFGVIGVEARVVEENATV